MHKHLQRVTLLSCLLISTLSFGQPPVEEGIAVEASSQQIAQAADHLDSLGLSEEATLVRSGLPSGSFLLTSRGLVYTFLMMKMMLLIHLADVCG